MPKTSDRIGKWFDWVAEHSQGLKTVVGFAIWAYGYYKNDPNLISIGSSLTTIGGGDKWRKFKETGSLGKALDIPAVRKIISKIPFRGGAKVPPKSQTPDNGQTQE